MNRLKWRRINNEKSWRLPETARLAAIENERNNEAPISPHVSARYTGIIPAVSSRTTTGHTVTQPDNERNRTMSQHDPNQSTQSNQSNQPNQPQPDEEPTDQQRYGQSDEFAQQGTLAEGYDQSEQMGESEWSAERYANQAGKVDRATLDEGEAQSGQQASDIDRMVGGMIGEDEDEATKDQR